MRKTIIEISSFRLGQDCFPEYLLIDSEGVVIEEGRIASQHLVDEDTQGPPVHSLHQCKVSISRKGGSGPNSSQPASVQG
jgi:hypothetical protein